MRNELTYEEAKNRYPDLFSAIEKRRAKCNSRYSSVPPEKCKWRLTWAQKFEGSTLSEIISGNKTRRLTIEERMERDLSSIFLLCLHCSYRNSRWIESFGEKREIPAEIILYFRAKNERECIEERRIDALTPEQRQAETAEILKKLSGSPGFVGIKF